MSWFRQRLVELSFPTADFLPSATSGVYFKAQINAHYRRTRVFHEDRDSFVRHEVRCFMSAITERWAADELYAAQDAVNAALGRPSKCSEGFYTDLTAHVQLSITEDGVKAARIERADRARIERLEFLKRTLYTDPSLMAIEYFEHHPECVTSEEIDITSFRNLANNLRSFDEWWSPLMTAWTELSANTAPREAVEQSMRVLLDAIQRLDAKLAMKYKLPTTNDLGR